MGETMEERQALGRLIEVGNLYDVRQDKVLVRLLRSPYFLGASIALALSLRIKSAAPARALTIKERRSFCALKKIFPIIFV